MTNKTNFFLISEEIARNYPDLRIGLVTGKDMMNRECDENLEKLTRTAETRIREKLSIESLASHPHISAWKTAYKTFGVNPKKYMPTCEALIRRVLTGEKVPTINVIVNCYLLAELEYILPCGGYDLNKLEGTIILRPSAGNEQFTPIGAKEIELTKPQEIVYSDDRRILTRKWNYRDSDVTKITEGTKNMVLFSEAPFRDIPTEALEGFVRRLSSLLTEFCSGSVEYNIVDFDKNIVKEVT